MITSILFDHASEQLISVREIIVYGGAVFFCEALYSVLLTAVVVDEVRHGLGGVCAYLERSGVIGENHYFEVLAAFPEISVHGTENFFADLFDRIYLVLDFAAVSAFVGSFHVNIYEIRAVAEGERDPLRKDKKI